MTPLQQKEITETKENIKYLLNERNHLAKLLLSSKEHKAPESVIKIVERNLQASQKKLDTELEYFQYLIDQIEENNAA